MYALNDYWSPLKTSCERKCAVRTIFVVKPPRKAYSLTSSVFLESGTPCPFWLFTPVFRGSLLKFAGKCGIIIQETAFLR